MSLIGIAVNNIRRRKFKAVILAVGLVIAVITAVSLFTVSTAMRENIDAQLDQFGTNLLITPRYKEMPLTYGGIVISNLGSKPIKELSMNDIPRMRTIYNKDNINIISPKLLGPIKYQGKNALLVGIQFMNELRIKTWWQYKGKKPEGKESAVVQSGLIKKRAIAATNFKKNEAIAGSNFAARFGIKPGDPITLGEGKNKGKYTIVSILKETGSSDDNVLFIELAEAQKVLNQKDKISLIEANAFCLDCPLLRIASQLQKKLPYTKVSGLKKVIAQKEQTLAVFTAFSIISSAIILLIAGVIVLVTMMASVNERTREIGIFRAVGFRKIHIIAIFLEEVAIISIAGGLVGYFIGWGISKALIPVIAPQAIGFYFNPNTISPLLMGVSIGGAFLIASVASLYPAIKAARMDPASALRFI